MPTAPSLSTPTMSPHWSYVSDAVAPVSSRTRIARRNVSAGRRCRGDRGRPRTSSHPDPSRGSTRRTRPGRRGATIDHGVRPGTSAGRPMTSSDGASWCATRTRSRRWPAARRRGRRRSGCRPPCRSRPGHDDVAVAARREDRRDGRGHEQREERRDGEGGSDRARGAGFAVGHVDVHGPLLPARPAGRSAGRAARPRLSGP